MSDIPDFIEFKGKKYPVDKEHYKQWAIPAAKRVLFFSQMNPIRIEMNGKLFGIIDLKDYVKIDEDGQGTTINLDKSGLKTKEDLIGLGGNYFQPFYVGADTVQEVIDSWDWLFEQMKISKRDFEYALEFTYILHFISSGKAEETIFRIMSLAIDLKSLSDQGIDVSQKIFELQSKIRGNMKGYFQRKNTQKAEALLRLELLTRELADLFAESRLARFAKEIGHDVKIGKNPDLLIDNVRVEVKHDRRDYMSAGGFVNKVRKGLKQKGNMVAIYTGSFGKKDVKEFKMTWLPMVPLDNALNRAIQSCKNGKKCVLLFTGTIKGYYGKMALIR